MIVNNKNYPGADVHGNLEANVRKGNQKDELFHLPVQLSAMGTHMYTQDQTSYSHLSIASVTQTS